MNAVNIDTLVAHKRIILFLAMYTRPKERYHLPTHIHIYASVQLRDADHPCKEAARGGLCVAFFNLSLRGRKSLAQLLRLPLQVLYPQAKAKQEPQKSLALPQLLCEHVTLLDWSFRTFTGASGIPIKGSSLDLEKLLHRWGRAG